MKNKKFDETTISGSAKFPWIIAYYIENHKTNGNSCNSNTAATIFYLIYYFSRLNEFKENKNALVDEHYTTRFTSVRLHNWFNHSTARTTLFRALNVLIELNLVVCIDDNNKYGNAYYISDLGLELVKNDIPWLDGDVTYALNKKSKNDNENDFGEFFDGVIIN